MNVYMEAGITVGEALKQSVLGMAIVFAMLLILAVIIVILNNVLKSMAKSAETSEAPAAAPVVAVPAVPVAPVVQAKVPAPGSVGEVKLYNVPDKQAAMIMAIVADEMKIPLNELRFISIKEIEK